MTVRGLRRAIDVAHRRQAGLRRRAFLLRVRTEAIRVDATVQVILDPSSSVGARTRVEVMPGTSTRIEIGPGVRLGDDVELSLRGGTLHIGRGTDVRRSASLRVGGRLDLGDDVVIGTGAHLHCAESLLIGDRTVLAEQVTITDSDHVRTPPHRHLIHEIVTGPVHIGSGVWLGARATVTRGVTIGAQSVIGAHAVVVEDVAAGWLVAGVPAREVRQVWP